MVDKYICQRQCAEFKKGMDEIVSAQMFCAVHSGGPKYSSKPFKYCPWCGSVLITNPEYEDLWDESKN